MNGCNSMNPHASDNMYLSVESIPSPPVIATPRVHA
jgi:hypothetical protein